MGDQTPSKCPQAHPISSPNDKSLNDSETFKQVIIEECEREKVSAEEAIDKRLEAWLQSKNYSIWGYSLSRVIGRGAFGTVYLGTKHDAKPENLSQSFWNTLPQETAIKIQGSPFSVAQARNEIASLNKLSSKFVVNMLAFAQPSTTDSETIHSIIVMEKCDCDIAQYADNSLDTTASQRAGGFSNNWARYFFGQLLSGMEFLRHRGMAHGDLSPQNVFVKDNRIKLGDLSNATVVPYLDHPDRSDVVDRLVCETIALGEILYVMLFGSFERAVRERFPHHDFSPMVIRTTLSDAIDILSDDVIQVSLMQSYPEHTSTDAYAFLAQLLRRQIFDIEDMREVDWFVNDDPPSGWQEKFPLYNKDLTSEHKDAWRKSALVAEKVALYRELKPWCPSSHAMANPSYPIRILEKNPEDVDTIWVRFYDSRRPQSATQHSRMQIPGK